MFSYGRPNRFIVCSGMFAYGITIRFIVYSGMFAYDVALPFSRTKRMPVLFRLLKYASLKKILYTNGCAEYV